MDKQNYLLIIIIINNLDILVKKIHRKYIDRVRVMVLNTTFNYISVISWRSFKLVAETGVHREYHRPATSH